MQQVKNREHPVAAAGGAARPRERAANGPAPHDPAVAPAGPLVAVDGVTKRYNGRTVLDGIRFAVERGEAFGIIGPNGSGKSTLLNLISGVEAPDGGRILLDGRPVADHPRMELARWVAVLQHGAGLAGGCTARDEVGWWPYSFLDWVCD